MRSQKYEFVPANRVFTDVVEADDETQVPVVPQWIRAEADLPGRYMWAALADELEEYYDGALFDVARNYVVDFPAMLQRGHGAFFMGTSGKGKTHTAAAIVNEIKRMWGNEKYISTTWLPVASRLKSLFDYRQFRKAEEYYGFKNRIFNDTLVVVDDLTHAAEHPETKEFLFALYDHREQHMLPTITTANAKTWENLEDVFNEPFVRRLRERSEGYAVSV